MNNEQFERKMEFLLNQQAQFDANMQQLQEGHKQLQESQKQLQETQKATEEKVDRLVGTTTILSQSLADLVELTTQGFKLSFERANNIDAKINALVDAQIRTDEMMRKTDETIRNLGVKFDRHLKEDHNGSKS